MLSELESLQQYPVYPGDIEIGGGKVTLQIGNSELLEIGLPVTAPSLLGIDKLDISTVEGAIEASLMLREQLKNFVYYSASQTA